MENLKYQSKKINKIDIHGRLWSKKQGEIVESTSPHFKDF